MRSRAKARLLPMKKTFLALVSITALAGCAPNDLFFTEYGEFYINSTPSGAMVCTTGGYCYGQTPTFIRIHEDNIVPYHKEGCWTIDQDFILTWSSGIKHQGNFYWCGRKLKRLQHTFNRPAGGDVTEDLKQDALANQTMTQKQQTVNQLLILQQMQNHGNNPWQRLGEGIGSLLGQ